MNEEATKSGSQRTTMVNSSEQVTGIAVLLQKIARRIRLKFQLGSFLRKSYLRLLGARIGSRTSLPRMIVPWPHQLQLGNSCVLQDDIFFNFDHYWVPGPSIIIGDRVFIGRGTEFNIRNRVEVANDVLIASGVKIIDHDHGIEPGQPMRLQEGPSIPVYIEEDVWIGANAIILKGVRLGRGSVVAAGAIVTRSVPEEEIWGGIPARQIGKRGGTEKAK